MTNTFLRNDATFAAVGSGDVSGVLLAANNLNDVASTATAQANLGVGSQMPGTTTNDNAASGNVGEVISSIIGSGSSVSLTTATAKTITSVILTAGDWDIWGTVSFLVGTATITYLIANVGPTTNSVANINSLTSNVVSYTGAALNANPISMPTGAARVSLASSTTYYLTAQAGFGAGSPTVYGSIMARRAR